VGHNVRRGTQPYEMDGTRCPMFYLGAAQLPLKEEVRPIISPQSRLRIVLGMQISYTGIVDVSERKGFNAYDFPRLCSQRDLFSLLPRCSFAVSR